MAGEDMLGLGPGRARDHEERAQDLLREGEEVEEAGPKHGLVGHGLQRVLVPGREVQQLLVRDDQSVAVGVVHAAGQGAKGVEAALAPAAKGDRADEVADKEHAVVGVGQGLSQPLPVGLGDGALDAFALLAAIGLVVVLARGLEQHDRLVAAKGLAVAGDDFVDHEVVSDALRLEHLAQQQLAEQVVGLVAVRGLAEAGLGQQHIESGLVQV